MRSLCELCGYPITGVVTNSLHWMDGRRGGLMVSVLDSGVSALGSSRGRRHCVMSLGKTLNSHGASLHPGV